MDNLTRWSVAEALDECGIYHNPKLEAELFAYAAKLRTQKQFQNIANRNYEKFCLRLIAFIENSPANQTDKNANFR